MCTVIFQVSFPFTYPPAVQSITLSTGEPSGGENGYIHWRGTDIDREKFIFITNSGR